MIKVLFLAFLLTFSFASAQRPQRPVEQAQKVEIEDFDFGTLFDSIKDAYKTVQEEAGKIDIGQLYNKSVNALKDGLDEAIRQGEAGLQKFRNHTKDLNISAIVRDFYERAKEKVQNFDLNKFIEKAINALKDGVDIAITQGEASVKLLEPENIKRRAIEIATALENIDLEKLSTDVIPCAMAFEKALPDLIAFAVAAADGKAENGVNNLRKLMPNLPELSEVCLGKPLEITPKTQNAVKCSTDIVTLSTMISQLVLVPQNVITNVMNISTMIDLIPATVADCAGAF
eukprot:CAMPEP_0176439030 /NCGR_PEP_ID=MMETSP0127-20121128/19679_1 /TAXON_ID=938130 /ORGANISM="Platyophrya macrostoma, Strain WH" /LENGTH=286 /DNA_ID=CAMNT_0017823179 /DNA_START=15 /DNA_END=875 /DNA_ORIENTATION=-